MSCNVINNPSFGAGIDSWIPAIGAADVITSDRATVGKNVLRLETSLSAPTSSVFQSLSDLDLASNYKLTVEVSVEGPLPVNGSCEDSVYASENESTDAIVSGVLQKAGEWVEPTGWFQPTVRDQDLHVVGSCVFEDTEEGHEPKSTPGRFYTGPETAWQWHSKDIETLVEGTVDHRALVSLEFSQASSSETPRIHLPDHLAVEPVPSDPKPFSAVSQGQSLAFSVAEHDVPEFLDFIQESVVEDSREDEPERYKWVVKTQQGSAQRGIAEVVRDSWTELVHLFNHAAPLDIIIMAAAYLAMHLTFGSLFVSMYHMGSRFWLFAGVLLSSTFAFLLALFTTTKLGFPVNLALLSEGLPFLVVTVGFENPIRLTQAVLQHATTPGEQTAQRPGPEEVARPTLSIIHSAIESSIKQDGRNIVKNYAAEVAVLLAGALCSIDPALRQFCVLAASILFFDCILLFLFYTAILSIKLEIIRIQNSGQEYLPKAVQDVGTTVFGQRLTRAHVRKFKLGMITTFVLVNVLNMSMIPFRITAASPSPSLRSLKDPLLAGSNGLDAILNQARLNDHPTTVTVLPPVKFDLQTPSTSNVRGEGLAGNGADSLLKSLDDPVLLKCFIVALVISVALNGRLFAAARSGVKDPGNATRDVSGLNTTSHQESQQKRLTNTLSPAGPEHSAAQLTPEPTSACLLHSPRPSTECQTMLREGRAQELTDEELINLSLSGSLPLHALEKTVKDFTRAVKVRRSIASRTRTTSELTHSLEVSDLPYEQYDWSRVFGVCCENVVGYMPIPVGLAGPLVIDRRSYFLPMATTEGVLIAGVMRGSQAINAGGGVQTVLTADGMTRGPCVTFESLERTAEAKQWLDSVSGQDTMKAAFNSTTRYGRLQSMKTVMAGTNLYIRFKATTDDAMGMNMISKGVEQALNTMRDTGFEDMDIISLSANYCSDKKPAAINWIDGRGKSVVAQAMIPPEIVKSVLKTDVDPMVALNMDKNLIGSAMAGSIGGFNAHAANIVAAMYIATGQDPAQVVESANCITIMKNVRGSLQISVSMPSIEVGTIGGGTTLGPQRAMLDMLGVRGANSETPGENARRLARIIAAGTLAAELSLCAALAAGHLVKAHMQHNRAGQ
ncbi:hydroxymethylglutaryl-coenzyme A reductase-domain-containing protein [Aspergillus varians]